MDNKDHMFTYHEKLAMLLSESERVKLDKVRDAKPPVYFAESGGADGESLFSQESLLDTWNEDLAAKAASLVAFKNRDGCAAMVMPSLAPRVNLSSEGYSEDAHQTAKMVAAESRGVYFAGVKPTIGGFGLKKSMLTGDKSFDEKSIAETFIKPLACFKKQTAPAVIYEKIDRDNKLPELLNAVFKPAYEYSLTADGADSLEEIRHGRRVLDGDVFYAESAYDEWLKTNELLKIGAISEEKVRQSIEKNEIIDEQTIDNAFNAYTAFEGEEVPPGGEFNLSEDDVLRQVAEESVVLLKNEDVLPFVKKVRLAVVGNCVVGDLQQALSDNKIASKFYDGYDSANEEGVLLDKEQLCDIAKSDAILFFIDNMRKRGRATELPSNRLAALDKLTSLRKKIVAVVIGNNPLDMSFDKACDGMFLSRSNCRMLGNALADMLIGKVNPSGRLSVSYYDHADELFGDIKKSEVLANTRRSTFFGYKYYAGSGLEVRYPFGFGLSYGASKITIVSTGNSQITVKAENESKFAVTETLQVYAGVNKLTPCAPRAEKELIAFKKVRLKPFESTYIKIFVDDEAFKRYSSDKGFVSERGECKIWVGKSSGDESNFRTIRISGAAPRPDIKKATDVFFWKSNIKSDGYYVEEGENLMKNSKKLSIVAWAMIIATLLVDISFITVWVTNNLPFGFFDTSLTLTIFAMMLNHVVLIAGIAILNGVKKRNAEVENLLKKIKAEKYNNARVLKNDSAKEVFRDVEIPEETDDDTEEIVENDSAVFAFDANITAESILTSLKKYLDESGFILATNELRSVLSSFASSKFIIANDVKKRKAVMRAVSSYFARSVISISVGNRTADELFTSEAFTSMTDYAAQNPDEIVVCLLDRVNEKNCNVLNKLLPYFNSPDSGKRLYTSADETRYIEITPNVYVVCVVDENVRFSALPKEFLSCAQLLLIDADEKQKAYIVNEFDRIGFNQFKTMTVNLENKVSVSEDAWKRIDKMEKELETDSFTVGNKEWQGMEKYAAWFISAGGDDVSMIDYLVAERIIPSAFISVKLADDQVSLKEKIDNAFGEDADKIMSTLKELEMSDFNVDGGKTVNGNKSYSEKTN